MIKGYDSRNAKEASCDGEGTPGPDELLVQDGCLRSKASNRT